MVTYDMAYLKSKCEMIFPEITSDKDNIIYRLSTKRPNSLMMEFIDGSRLPLIFVYNDRRNYKLMTKECFDEEEKAILGLRAKLSKSQNILRNERRNKIT